jgi:hypothetical protein
MAALDDGYVRNWHDRKSNFELILGRSVPEDRAPRYLGLVHGYGRKPNIADHVHGYHPQNPPRPHGVKGKDTYKAN